LQNDIFQTQYGMADLLLDMPQKTTEAGRTPPRRGEGKHQSTIKWSQELVDQIDTLAEANMRSRSAQIEYMLKKYLPVEEKLAGLAE
jgi:hypothetical protein